MKTACLSICMLAAFIASAQQVFYRQVRAIVADSANHFGKFRGAIKPGKSPVDQSFFSTIQIEGTTENEIYYLDSLAWVYDAIIADSLPLNKAKKLADEWKEKIEVAVAGQFIVSKYKVVDYSPGVYGWRFSYKRFEIEILVLPLADKNRNRIYLSFMQ